MQHVIALVHHATLHCTTLHHTGRKIERSNLSLQSKDAQIGSRATLCAYYMNAANGLT
jgi:hypothetical protein